MLDDVQPLPAAHDPADAGAADRRRRALHRPAELRGVLPVDGLARRRVARTSTATARYARLQAGGGYAVQTPPVGPGRAALHSSAAAPPLGTRPGQEPEAALQARAPSATSSRRRTCPTRRSGAGREAPDQEAARVFVAILFLLVGVARDRGLHPVEPALLPAGLGAAWSAPTSTGEGRAADRPGRRAGPGADRERRRREGRRGGLRDARGRHRRRRHEIQEKYKPIYRDASVLLRPKTGLKDMYLALDPGTQSAGDAPRGRPRAGGEHAART